MTMHVQRYILAIFVLSLLASCSGKAAVRTAEDYDPEKSFTRANKLIDEKEYAEARATLLEIRNRDLSKKYAPLAQLRVADSYVREEEPELAVAEYRKFLELYPDHRHAAYAQYQIAMVYFNQIEGPERGYGGAAQALAEFEKLKREYPRNPYKDLVDLRIEKCRNVIADYEYLVGEFYMKNASYGAAISRFEGLLKTYPEYKKQDDILYNLGVAYRKSGQQEKAETSLRQLLERFPTSRLVNDAKKELAAVQAGKK